MQNIRKYYRFLRSFRDLEEKSAEVIRHHEVPLEWLHKKLRRNQFLTLSGILVGCTAGLAGVLLKALVHFIHLFITQDYHLPYQLLFYLIFPFLGILLTVVIVRFVLKGKDGKGIPKVLSEIAQKSSMVDPRKMYSQIIQGAVTVGLGGSAGLESPIAITGAAIGSNYARTYRLNYKERTLLLAAGAAAGIAAAFDAPIAGVMFAMEVLLAGVVFSDFIPLIIASVCGALLSKIILGDEIILHFRLKQDFNYWNVPFYLALGVLSGLYSRYYMLMANRVDHFFERYRGRVFLRGIIGGAALSLLCFFFPPLFGDGYESIKVLVDQSGASLLTGSLYVNLIQHSWAVLVFVGLICLAKVFATTVTISSGGNGGNFAPSLFAGAFLGYCFAYALSMAGWVELPIANFAIVGMAGAMSGIMYAPLTSIFLIAEATGGYDLFIPLMIVSTTSYLIVRRFSPYSLEVKRLVDKGQVFTRQHDRNLLSLLHTGDIIEKDIRIISPEATLRELVALIKISSRNLFGVVNDAGELEGIIVLDDVKEVMFNTELYDSTHIRQLMKNPPAFIDVQEPMQQVMKKFDETGAWNLPVTNGKKFLGFVSKSSLLNRYRQLLKDYSTSEEEL
ncbi:chloride channel protein [Compostibacter hankyongensis]|uniref:Chloride channel protein n=1 Tax=Compostibacter hankyongensis TaxID=1007089 RepID=A0ABP8FVS1_9BACT